VPEAVTLKLASVPRMFVRLCGCPVITGGTHTVNTATPLVTDPNVLVTTTV
jgi:hypothetical protein